jgi:WD40 repeat protein
MAISPDGHKLATASLDQTLKLWDTKSGDQLQSLTPGAAIITGMAFSPDGKWLATTGHDTAVKIWDVAAGKVTRSFATGRYFVSGIGFSPDGMYFACPALAGFKVWDTPNWRERYFPLSKFVPVQQDGRLAFVPGGKRLVTIAIDGVRVWDSEAWREIVTRTVPHFPFGSQALAFSADGNYAATAEGNGDVRLWYLSPLVIPRPESDSAAR